MNGPMMTAAIPSGAVRHDQVNSIVLAAGGSIQPGKHIEVQFLGLTFNIDTIIGTVFAGAVVCGLGLYMARGATRGKPSKVQLAFEHLIEWVQGQVREGMGMRAPRGVVSLSVALFAFILISNWVSQLPGHEEGVQAPTADVNLVYPMMFMVIVWVNVTAIRNRGVGGYLKHFAEPYAFLAPFEVITQYFARPVSLALRLWGNIFAGGIMISLIALLPPYVLWAPTALWKAFELFIGVIQALIFTLLTIIYFSEAVGEEAEGH